VRSPASASESALLASSRGLALRWPSSSPFGYGLLKLLAGLRRFRRNGRGFRHEQAAIDRWLNAVTYTRGRDSELALLVARLAIWARGYGEVRERGLAQLERLLSDWQQRFADNPVTLTAELSDSLNQAQTDPDGVHCG
jgi:indolepyruvate ferredoxin oxidoreductase beta subunit